MERGSLQYGPPSGPLAEYQLEHVVSRIDAGHVNQAFAATVLFLFLPRDIVSIELKLCFFVIRSIQDKDKLVVRSYLSC